MYALIRYGWLYKGSGCIWRVYSLEETLGHSYLKRQKSLTILTKRLKRYDDTIDCTCTVLYYATVVHCMDSPYR